MCIAIYKPAKIELSEETLQNCWDNNDDGAGYMFSWNNELVIRKGFFSFDDFYSMYKIDSEDNPESNFVLHFRISTSGNIDKRNTHPHRITKDLALVHNGVLSIDVPNGSPFSDTILFSKVLSSLPRGWNKNHGIIFLVEEYLGSRNKIVLMNNKGKVFIINENAGKWDNGCWFSNNSYHYSRTYSCGYTTSCYSPGYTVTKPNKEIKLLKPSPATVSSDIVEQSKLVNSVFKLGSSTGCIDTTSGIIYAEDCCYIPVEEEDIPRNYEVTPGRGAYYVRLPYADPMFSDKLQNTVGFLTYEDTILNFPKGDIENKALCDCCHEVFNKSYVDEDLGMCIPCFMDFETKVGKAG